MKYQLFIERRAQRQLAKIPERDRERIIITIGGLAEDPRPAGVKKLSGRDAWRIRIGDYRVIFEIHDEVLVVRVIIIRHRRDVYRS